MQSSQKIILVDAVYTFVVENEGSFVISHEMYELLETLPNKKIILTGADDEQFKKFGLGKMPYEVFTLKHNPEKTDPEYFKKFLKRFDLEPEQALYFEHDSQAVKSAESVGIISYLYDSEKRDLIALKKFLEKHL